MEAQLEKTRTSLALKRVFQAPKARVYQAWTDPEMLNGWFYPEAGMQAVCQVDLRVGGRYEVRMHPPEGAPEGAPYVAAGVYREIIPEEKLVFTWQWQGDEANEETLITVRFRSINDNETELTLLHERFGSEESRDSHAQGWEGTFAQLEIALSD